MDEPLLLEEESGIDTHNSIVSIYLTNLFKYGKLQFRDTLNLDMNAQIVENLPDKSEFYRKGQKFIKALGENTEVYFNFRY